VRLSDDVVLGRWDVGRRGRANDERVVEPVYGLPNSPLTTVEFDVGHIDRPGMAEHRMPQILAIHRFLWPTGAVSSCFRVLDTDPFAACATAHKCARSTALRDLSEWSLAIRTAWPDRDPQRWRADGETHCRSLRAPSAALVQRRRTGRPSGLRAIRSRSRLCRHATTLMRHRWCRRMRQKLPRAECTARVNAGTRRATRRSREGFTTDRSAATSPAADWR